MKLQHSGKEYFLYVPQALIDFFGWEKGDRFYPTPIENGILYTKLEKKSTENGFLPGKDNTDVEA
jgi:hypothetical protein